MFELKIQDIQKGFWFKGTKKIAFRLNPSSPLEQIPVAQLLKNYIPYLTPLLPQKLDTKNLNIKNLRGRPFESFPEIAFIPESSSNIREEEIFFSKGKVLNPNVDTNKESTTDEKESVFTFSLRSNFQEYTPSGHVSHNLKPLTTGSIKFLEKYITPLALAEWLPLELDCFRFGVEQYKKKFLGSMAGLVPMINNRFYIEVNKNEIFVLIEQADQKRKNKIPLQEHLAVSGLEKALDTSLKFKDLTKAIKKEINQ